MANSIHTIRRKTPFQAFLADIQTIGVMPEKVNGDLYAVLSARSNERWWLLPLEDRRASVAALDMLRPITTTTMLAKQAVKLLTRFGPRFLIGPAKLRLSSLPDLGDAFNHRERFVTYFTGTDGPHRKTSMQFLDNESKLLGYAKMSRKKNVRPYILNEARTLSRLAEFNLKTASTPEITKFHNGDNLTLLATDGIEAKARINSVSLGERHLAFLNELRLKSQRCGAESVLEMIAKPISNLETKAAEEWSARLRKVYDALLPSAAEIPMCFSHGDFTPWNIILLSRGLYVFDWEYANPNYPVGFDLVHFRLSTLTRSTRTDTVAALTQELENAFFFCDQSAALRSLLLSLACHAFFYLERIAHADLPISDWQDGQMRGGLIDRVLLRIEA